MRTEKEIREKLGEIVEELNIFHKKQPNYSKFTNSQSLKLDRLVIQKTLLKWVLGI